MQMIPIIAILLPFFGTCAGALSVFLMRNALNRQLQRALTGFAAGVMVAASIWSLLIPAMEQSAGLGRLAFFPGAVGLGAGFALLLVLDHRIPHLHSGNAAPEGSPCHWEKTTMLVFAVALHNLPEGMAVGAVAAGWMAEGSGISSAALLALSAGIALQNLPEGAIVSMPLHAGGMGRGRAFWCGVLSGIIEPLGAAATVLFSALAVPALPYLLSFSAGAMLYVVVEELIPEMAEGEHSDIGTVAFAAGFCLMMVMDVALG